MKFSQSIIKIAPALLEAQKKIGSAKKGSVNPFFHSNYASLGDVMEACKDILNENGIVVLQPIGTDENGVFVETVLLHTSGEYISEGMRIAPKSETNPQDQGSAISYARRYSLQSMVFIPAEDDDGEKATNRASSQKTTSDTVSYPASDKQKDYIVKLADQKGLDVPSDEYLKGLTKDQAGKRIEELLKLPADILNQVNESFENGDTGIEGNYGDK